MKKISEIENNIEAYLNDDTLFDKIPVYENSLSGMTRIGKIPNTTLEIHIEGGEGYIPHMHICKKSGKNVVMRIKLLSNEYFREKDDRMNVLSSKERKALNKYFNQKVPFINLTNWQSTVMMWNNYNPAHLVDFTKIHQPDYTAINEPK